MSFQMIHPTDAIRMIQEEQNRYFAGQQLVSEATESKSSTLVRITNWLMPGRPEAVKVVVSDDAQTGACCVA